MLEFFFVPILLIGGMLESSPSPSSISSSSYLPKIPKLLLSFFYAFHLLKLFLAIPFSWIERHHFSLSNI
ncbi:hypothetical protein AQUCO_02700041v1 [Aquilegia coerulea]|uniref:Uncharacterized protein n=1 Tax=Aquilegia coerulea TaxID=218851 RepID=A0A2G5D4W7_AQUCA|nr:hypothetical protein AQUCO_02700041v1 [Aquilegia coerulea]